MAAADLRMGSEQGERSGTGRLPSWYTPPMRGARLAVFAVWALVFAGYAPSLSGDLVQDDWFNISANFVLRQPWRWPMFFWEPKAVTRAEDAEDSYRPLMALSYGLTMQAAGANPFWYHLADISAHSANAALLFALARPCAGPWAALGGALLFAFHPAQAESVSYTSGARPNTFSLLLCLTALFLYKRPVSAGERAASVVCFAAALLFKEPAAVFPLLLTVYDWTFSNDRLRAVLKRTATYWAVLAAYLPLRVWILGEASQRGPWGGSWAEHWRTACAAVVEFAGLLLGGGGSACRSEWALGPAAASAVTAAVLGLFAGAFYLLYKGRQEGLGLFWTLAGWLPVSQLAPLVIFAADRFLYYPLAGLALLAATVMRRLPRGIAALVLAAEAAAMFPANFDRQMAWQNGFELASRAASREKDPCGSAILATHYVNWGMYDRAEALALRGAKDESPELFRRFSQTVLNEARLRRARRAAVKAAARRLGRGKAPRTREAAPAPPRAGPAGP